MGWFLSSSKKKTKKKSGRSKSVDPSWDPMRTLLGVKFAGAAGAVLAIALGWHFGTQRLEAYVSGQHAQPITAQDIVFSEDPQQMSPAQINLLRAELAALIGEDPLDRVGLRNAAELLRGRQDIVRELRQIRRTPEGTIEIDLAFRTPAAIVQMRNAETGRLAQDGYHVIDEQGYHMYGPRSMHDLPFDLPQIIGVRSDYRPKDNLGEYQWQGPEVAAGLALIHALSDSPAIDHIDSISVNLRDERGRIRLVINTEIRPNTYCSIVWGLPPGEERGIEVDPDRKIAALEVALADGRYRTGLWSEIWINTGDVRLGQAIGGN